MPYEKIWTAALSLLFLCLAAAYVSSSVILQSVDYHRNKAIIKCSYAYIPEKLSTYVTTVPVDYKIAVVAKLSHECMSMHILSTLCTYVYVAT